MENDNLIDDDSLMSYDNELQYHSLMPDDNLIDDGTWLD